MYLLFSSKLLQSIILRIFITTILIFLNKRYMIRKLLLLTMIKYQKLFYEYDKNKLINEILSNRPYFHHMPPDFLTLKRRKFSLIDGKDYNDLTIVHESNIIAGKINSWQGVSFTYKKGLNESKSGKNSLRSQYDEWNWRYELNSNYLQEIVKELGFYEVQNVRAMIIDPPGFGPVHKDACQPGYYDKNISVTLNLQNGSKPLVALLDDSLVEIDEDVFIFQDDCWHGVGTVVSQRIQVRINGKVKDIDQFF